MTANTAAGSIAQRPITVTAQTDSKVYDGTTASAAAPVVGGGLGAGDSAGFVQTYDDRNVGSGKTMTASGAVNDGNGGANYLVSFVPNSTAVITPRPVTVAAQPDTKVDDGTTVSTATPVIVGALGAGDSASGLAQVFDSPDVGNRTLLVSGYVLNDGNGGANYLVSKASAAGAILAGSDVSSVITPAISQINNVPVTDYLPSTVDGASLAETAKLEERRKALGLGSVVCN